MKVLAMMGILAGAQAILPTFDVVTPQDLVVREDAPCRANVKLSPEEIRRDVSVFAYAFENGYAGYKYMPNELRDGFRPRVEAILRNESVTTPAALCEAIDDILAEIPDEHLHAALNGPCSKRRKPRATATIGENAWRDPKKPWGVTYAIVGETRIPVVSVTSFPPHSSSAWDGFRDAVSNAMKAKALVVDLRGNGGGDDTTGRWLADALYGGHSPTRTLRVIERQTPATMAIYLNSVLSDVIEYKRRKLPVPQWAIDDAEESQSRFEQALRGELPAERVQEVAQSSDPFDAKRGFAGPIMVLADRRCMSACESSVAVLKGHPHVQLVGANTRGCTHFGNNGFIVLPNSRIDVHLATHFTEHRDGEFVERVGYAPDVRVPEGQDALKVALEKIAGGFARH